MADPVDQLTTLTDLTGISPEEKGRRIPIWHRSEQRKISGCAAPLRKNLAKYLQKHHSCDVYVGQDRFCALKPGDIDRKTGKRINAEDIGRVTMWNRLKKRRLSGNSAPLRKNLEKCLRRNPNVEIYIGQDRCGDGYHAPDCEAILGREGAPCVREDFQRSESDKVGTESLSTSSADVFPCKLDDFQHVKEEFEIFFKDLHLLPLTELASPFDSTN